MVAGNAPAPFLITNPSWLARTIEFDPSYRPIMSVRGTNCPGLIIPTAVKTPGGLTITEERSAVSKVFVPAVKAAVVLIPASLTSEVAWDVLVLALLVVRVARVPPDPAAVHALAAVNLRCNGPTITVVLMAGRVRTAALIATPCTIATRLAPVT
jgi:hypothetical protein